MENGLLQLINPHVRPDRVAHDQPGPDRHTATIADRATGAQIWEGTIRKNDAGSFVAVSRWRSNLRKPFDEHHSADEAFRDIDGARRWLAERVEEGTE